MIRHLYVHIPFCPKVCPYCSFYKEASDRNKTQAFLDAVLKELDGALTRWEIQPQTIFFGGGTPSALSFSQLDFLLRGLRERLDLSRLVEWTLEMNPATVSLEKARLLRELGVTRISMGVQSWDPHLLVTLGRVHSAQQAERSFEILRNAGFPAVNLDLIYGIPGQTEIQWEASLQKTMSLRPEHISAYCLTYEEDTEFFKRFLSGEYRPEDDRDERFFRMTVHQLAAGGYDQYEISNYARPGQECVHNLAYWQGADYLGLGPSAFSTVGNLRWQNMPDTFGYTAAVLSGANARSSVEQLDRSTRELERLAFSLRTREGVTPDQLQGKQGTLDELAELGLLSQSEGRITLTLEGRLLADEIATRLI
jgi:oxygen-independent coproporphyrinogen-3 oxidase